MATQLLAFHKPVGNDPTKQIVTTPEQFERLIRWLETRKKIVVDYETSGLNWFQHAQACGMGLASWDDNGQIWNAYVPFRHATGEKQLDLSRIGPAIKQLLENPNSMKIAHNIKFEDHFSRKEGWKITGPRYDTLVGARLYNDNLPLKLESRAESDLGIQNSMRWNNELQDEIKRLAKSNGMKIEVYKSKYGYSEVNINLCGVYCCTDTFHTASLHDLYEKWGMSSIYSRIWPTEMRLTEVLCDLEENGMLVDVPYLLDVQRQVREAKERLEAQIVSNMGGYRFNIASDDELRAILWHTMGLRWEKKTKGNQLAVDREVLEQFADQNIVCKLIMDWRDAEKIDTTYTSSILELLDSKNYVHGNMQQMGTNSGRMSCSSPNYQNFSNDDEDRARGFSGKKLEEGGIDPWSIRRAFVVSSSKHARIYYDFSQIELRVLAHYSQDPIMVDAYLKGEDLHTRTSKEITSIRGTECPRRVGKCINFGLSFCLSEKGLARQAKIPVDEAQKVLQAFFQRYSGVASFRQELWAKARRDGGQAVNLFGRVRRVPDLLSDEFWKRKRAERQMIGSIIQGTAAELTKESLVRIADWFKAEKIPALLVNTVHDEIQIDCPREYIHKVAQGVKALMQDFPEFAPIPILTDEKITFKSWADKESYKKEKDYGI